METQEFIIKDDELAFWAGQVKPLVKFLGGIFKFWIKPLDLKDSIFDAKPLALARVKKIKTLKIDILPESTFGKPFVTQAMIIKRIPKEILRGADAYTVKLGKLVCDADSTKYTPSFYEATINLYRAKTKPIQVILQKTQYAKIEREKNPPKDVSIKERKLVVKDAKTLDFY